MANEPCTPHCPAGDCAGCAFPPRVSCMGGFCAVREDCRHYTVDGAVRFRAAERLCAAGTLSHFSPAAERTFLSVPREPQLANSVFGFARSLGVTA
jgi:hypothetical protein